MNQFIECCQPPMQHIHHQVCREDGVNANSVMDLLNPEASLSQKWMPGYGCTVCLGCLLTCVLS